MITSSLLFSVGMVEAHRGNDYGGQEQIEDNAVPYSAGRVDDAIIKTAVKTPQEQWSAWYTEPNSTASEDAFKKIIAVSGTTTTGIESMDDDDCSGAPISFNSVMFEDLKNIPQTKIPASLRNSEMLMMEVVDTLPTDYNQDNQPPVVGEEYHYH